ncbi:MAG: ABC transporter ATP-binding protein [Spirochaetaceae bacterium]|nr:MAG: ABC transporter ATP-binding protein [Spirochaetaceae bacterium]
MADIPMSTPELTRKPEDNAVLRVDGLEVEYPGAPVVRGVSFSLSRGEALAIVGESGAGKTQTLYALLGLRSPDAVYRGSVVLAGRTMTSLPDAEAARVRGREVGMVFQNPGPYLNPAWRIGSQIAETVRVHTGLSREAAQRRVKEVLEQVELAPEAARLFPHQLSGGMQQRAMIAMAVSCGPELLLMDEPTSALDAPIRRRHIELIAELRREMGLAVVVVTHDIEVVRDIADRVIVMYCGRIIEEGTAASVLEHSRHPYTELLLSSAPSVHKRGQRLPAIGGDVPRPGDIPSGCSFHPRCPLADEICRGAEPILSGTTHRAACYFSDRLPLGEAGLRNSTPGRNI